ncbi:MAG: AAA family ATPase, partial [Shinella sp.]
MSLNAGLTTIHEDDIAKHQAMAQSLVTKLVILESEDGKSGTALAGTGRRFVSTVSTAGTRRTREVELAKTIQSVRAADPLLSP